MAREWMQTQLSAKPFESIPELFHYSCNINRKTKVTQAEVEQLRREVGDKVNHPKLGELKRKEAMLNGSGDEHVDLWYGNSTIWRMNMSRSDGPSATSYVDLGKNGAEIWSLNPDQLSVLPAHGSPPTGRDIQGTFNLKVANTFDLFFSGGLSDLILLNATLVDIYTFEKNFVAQIASGQTTWYFQYEWSDAFGTFVPRGRSLTDPRKGPAAIEWLFGEWQMDERNLPYCRKATLAGAKAETVTTYRLESFSPAALSQIQKLAATPDKKTPDPVRGQLNYTATYDGRSSEPRLVEKLRNGSERTWRPADHGVQNKRSTLQLFVWISVIVSVGTIVALRLRQRTVHIA